MARNPRLSCCFLVLAGISLGMPAPVSALDAISSDGPLTLPRAIELALAGNADLQVFAWDLRAALARRIQAALRPNPEAALEAENLSGTLPGFSRSEVTLSLGQILELGGKRGARVGAARAEETLVSKDYEITKLAVLASVTRQFFETLVAQDFLVLQEETLRLSEGIKASVAARVAAGAVSPVEEVRADVELQNVLVRHRDAEQQLALSRARLSLLWGDANPHFSRALGQLDTLPPLPAMNQLLARRHDAPQATRALSEIQLARSRLALARTGRSTDLRLEGGLRFLKESDDRAFVMGLSAPLALFNRNQGNIAEAAALLSRAESDTMRLRVEWTRSLTEAYIAVSRARARAEALKGQILPGAERAFEEIQAGYERGRFSYVDLLEARRAWAAARQELLSALIDYHLSMTDTELLLGGPLIQSRTTEQGGQEK